MTSERPVDAISERYVEESAALEPLMATYLGIAGYEDKLPDLTPDGSGAREQLTRDALAARTSARRSPRLPSWSGWGLRWSRPRPACREARCR